MRFPELNGEYTVAIITLTYNHSAYIESTINGILSQKTNFPVVTLILDDCSTDGTADVIRKYETLYPDQIKGVYFEENQFSQGKRTFTYLLPYFSKTRYIAFCEGDDYWTDPLKLQKQVDLMEKRSDCSLCFHSVIEHWQDGSAPDKVFYHVEERAYAGIEIFKQWIMATASVMIRSNIFKDRQLIDIIGNKNLMYYDQALYLYCSIVGEVFGTSDVMAVYRRLNVGYSLRLEKNLQRSYQIIDSYCTHIQTIGAIFEKQLGTEFRKETINRFVSHALDGFLLSTVNMNFKYACHFFLRSFRYDGIKTFKMLGRKVIKERLLHK